MTEPFSNVQDDYFRTRIVGKCSSFLFSGASLVSLVAFRAETNVLDHWHFEVARMSEYEAIESATTELVRINLVRLKSLPSFTFTC